MPIIKAPQYSKSLNPKSGVIEPSYIFIIDFDESEKDISFIAETESDISLQGLQKCVLENTEWWNNFISEFLKSTTKYFTKSYTVEQINKITKHTLNGVVNTNSYPVSVSLLPKKIQIIGGCFIVNWDYKTESVVINIPDLEDLGMNNTESLPVLKKINDDLEELNIDDIPSENNITDTTFHLDNPSKIYEKQKVKEARLKAKLAVYKAQRQMTEYYEKYGDDISDSDSDFETSDEEYDSESEEVQL